MDSWLQNEYVVVTTADLMILDSHKLVFLRCSWNRIRAHKAHWPLLLAQLYGDLCVYYYR